MPTVHKTSEKFDKSDLPLLRKMLQAFENSKPEFLCGQQIRR